MLSSPTSEEEEKRVDVNVEEPVIQNLDSPAQHLDFRAELNSGDNTEKVIIHFYL